MLPFFRKPLKHLFQKIKLINTPHPAPVEEHIFRSPHPCKTEYYVPVPGLAVGLLPLHAGRTEHLKPLHTGLDHGEPIGILDMPRFLAGMAENLVDPGDQAQVEPSTLCPTLFVAGALTLVSYKFFWFIFFLSEN